MSEAPAAYFAVCLDNKGYEASLEVGKLYRVIPDTERRRRTVTSESWMKAEKITPFWQVAFTGWNCRGPWKEPCWRHLDPEHYRETIRVSRKVVVEPVYRERSIFGSN